ncbi:MAG TPA: hypothetical protein VEA58_11530 [Anaerovoracaceae bacterium]|nr:hypothetical protein [Anaerovoracaceae bacterium]
MPIVRPIKRYFDPPHLLRKYLFETISRRELKILKRSLKKRPESDLSEEAGFADIMRRIREGRVTLQELDHLKAMMDTSPSRLRIVYEQTSSRHFLEGLRQAALASDARERGFKQIEAHMQSKGLWKEDCSN